MPSRIPDGGQRGWIVPIGGAEDKESRRRILKRFVDLCGGRDADIVVIPTASRKPDTGSRYEDLFDRLPLAVNHFGKAAAVGPVEIDIGVLDGFRCVGHSWLSILNTLIVGREYHLFNDRSNRGFS